ncbi:hypothetical protein ANN_26154 [Periplaneta americana]|uniref:Uncharacterized protein n=1 Tax=Periplaneta americana TaxID=6978 RepID=A0ABQ8S5K6_PERAM|nr:hypothetical protein ANN_26154 [Periplaneta americana]
MRLAIASGVTKASSSDTGDISSPSLLFDEPSNSTRDTVTKDTNSSSMTAKDIQRHNIKNNESQKAGLQNEWLNVWNEENMWSRKKEAYLWIDCKQEKYCDAVKYRFRHFRANTCFQYPRYRKSVESPSFTTIKNNR